MNENLNADERENNMEVIKRNGELLSKLINDILDLSKVEAGKLEIEKIPVPSSEIMSEIGSIHNLEAAEKGIEFKISAEGEIPSTIQTDPTRLRQILFNIIGNALKFTVRGHVRIVVKMTKHETGSDKLAFVVEDSGEGIRPEHTSKLFMPFTQADASTTRRFGGTGLGLVLSRKLANELGGDIVLVKSTPHVGSTFMVTIDPGAPSATTTADSLSVPLKSRAVAKDETVSLSNLRVLLVDDSHENQILIKTYLNVAGAVVEIANNGREAVEKAMKGNFDLVLMDLQMPEMDGYQATAELRKLNFKKPIIALTAHAMKEDRRRCLENGFNEHLTKPVDRRSLLHTIAEFSL